MLAKFALNKIFFTVKFLLRGVKEFFIFTAQHYDVYVVIPRNKSSVPHRAKRGAGKKHIFYVVGAAHRVKIPKH